MIYECSLVAKTDLGDSEVTKLQELVREVVKQHDGEVLIEDDWNVLRFAQPTSEGVQNGRFLYTIFSANSECNKELARRFGINEGVLKYMTLKLGEETQREEVVKKYKTPFSTKYGGSVTDDLDESRDFEKDRKRFAKRKSCWFNITNITVDWKDPKTYAWLVNEFGKISPARISGISRKHQRFANTAIKRARNLGLISHLSGRVATKA